MPLTKSHYYYCQYPTRWPLDYAAQYLPTATTPEALAALPGGLRLCVVAGVGLTVLMNQLSDAVQYLVWLQDCLQVTMTVERPCDEEICTTAYDDSRDYRVKEYPVVRIEAPEPLARASLASGRLVTTLPSLADGTPVPDFSRRTTYDDFWHQTRPETAEEVRDRLAGWVDALHDEAEACSRDATFESRAPYTITPGQDGEGMTITLRGRWTFLRDPNWINPSDGYRLPWEPGAQGQIMELTVGPDRSRLETNGVRA
jgi:hypothetical protein